MKNDNQLAGQAQVNGNNQVEKKNIKSPVDIQNSEQIKQFLMNYKRIKKVKGIKVPVLQTNHYHKQLKKTKTLLQIPNLDKIIDSPPTSKIILVQKDFTIDQIQLIKNKQGQQQNHTEIVQQQIQINYKNLSTQQLFDLFTGYPNLIPYPNSFQTVGHLAHFNLTAEQIPYHKVIGEITLLKAPNITCVVNKTEKLHNVYRTPTLEMMAGVKEYNVKLKEVGTAFQFDFQKVYWCSRLQQQRDRLLSKMKKGECLADIFCGCGPLAVRAAKKGVYVIANDLNPYGYEYLVHNCKINHVQDKMICYNMCARQVMRKIYASKQLYPASFQNPDHIYMNLPVDAIQFLDVFTNYAQDMKTQKMPLVHVNCFVVAQTQQKSKQLLAQRISKTLPGFKQEDFVEMNHIKNVTIIMRMYCVTFRLRRKYGEVNQINQNDKNSNKNQEGLQNQNGHKKIKLNEND